MKFLDYFRSKRKGTASVAKERLQIIVAHERVNENGPDFLPRLQQDIVEVIRRYVDVEQNSVNVNLDKNDEYSVLELNITLPDLDKSKTKKF